MGKPRPVLDCSIYQLKVTLRGSQPPIWRRFEVNGATSLEKLHRILQIGFGWTNSHLHRFIIDEEVYGLPEFELDEYGDEIKNERLAKLGRMGFRAKSNFVYQYDFGDNWISRHRCGKGVRERASGHLSVVYRRLACRTSR